MVRGSSASTPERARGLSRGGDRGAAARTGRWFPRVDLVGSAGGRRRCWRSCLRLRPRSAARRRACSSHRPGDPRCRPRVKGPDLDAAARAARRGRRARAPTSCVLRDAAGRLLEGALTACCGGRTSALCTTPDGAHAAGRHARAAARRSRASAASRCGCARRWPGELAGCETWLTNALHGIRVVSAWGAAPGGGRAGAAPRTGARRSTASSDGDVAGPPRARRLAPAPGGGARRQPDGGAGGRSSRRALPSARPSAVAHGLAQFLELLEQLALAAQDVVDLALDARAGRRASCRASSSCPASSSCLGPSPARGLRRARRRPAPAASSGTSPVLM